MYFAVAVAVILRALAKKEENAIFVNWENFCTRKFDEVQMHSAFDFTILLNAK